MAKIEIELEIPSVPNFIFAKNRKPGRRQDGWKEAAKFAIAELSDEQLGSIADDWKVALLERARESRAEKETK